MAGIGVSLTIEGLAELEEDVRRMAKSVNADNVEPLLAEGARMIRDRARELAPVKLGVLRRAVIYKKLSRRGANRPAPYLVGVDRKKAPHAFIVEHGSPGRFKKQSKGKASFRRRLGASSGPMPARPFLRPAWDELKDDAYTVVRDGIKREIEEAIT